MKNKDIGKRTKILTFFMISTIFMIILLQVATTIQADLIPPPQAWTPFTLAVFLINLFINFLIFGIAYLIFIERNIQNINKKKFLITIFLITLVGFIADSLTLHFSYRLHGITIFGVILASCFILILDFLICRYYLKLEKKKSFILGIWMTIFTNPYIYIIVTAFLPRF